MPDLLAIGAFAILVAFPPEGDTIDAYVLRMPEGGYGRPEPALL